MATDEQPTVKFGPFVKGVNNVDRATALAADELLHAVNVDIDRNGIVSRRKGYDKILTLANSHSLWARDAKTAFVVSANTLRRLDRNETGVISNSVASAAIFEDGRPVNYLNVNGAVYWSNGIRNGRVLPDSPSAQQSRAWSVERPGVPPTLAAIAGSMPAGIYRVCVTFLNELGEESGATVPASIELTAPGAIRLSAMQAPPEGEATRLRVYLSAVNGELCYRHSEVVASTTTLDLAQSATLSNAVRTLYMERMVPTEMLEFYNGRIYGAAGRVVWFTEALNFGLHSPQRNFILFPRDVAVMKAVVDGIYFATDDRTYFYAGASPDVFAPRIVLPYGAIKNTGLALPKTEQAAGRRVGDTGTVVGWFSERGFVKGLSGGSVQLGDKERIMVGMFGVGGSLYRESDGLRQVIGTMKNPSTAPMVSKDFAEAEVRRNTPVTA